MAWEANIKRNNSLDFQFVLSDAHQLSGRSGGSEACDCGEFGIVDLVVIIAWLDIILLFTRVWR
jgi:hypothetical protein